MRFTSRTVLLDAPTNLGLKPPSRGHQPGVRSFAAALRSRGLASRLKAADAGAVPVPDYRFRIDRATGVRNTAGIVRFSRALADALEPMLQRGDFPIVLGGDCSLLLGPALALRRLGPFGLCFVDGHQDLLTPDSTQTGGAAGMDLALACGIGPPALTRLAGTEPLVEPAHVLLIGDRSGDEGYPGQAIRRLRSRIFQAPLATLRREGVRDALNDGLGHLRSRGIDRAWLHFDVDVLDDAIMPAVDSRQPDGLSWAEGEELLHGLLTSGLLCGMNLTILDPERDPDGSAVEGLARVLERSFSAARASA